MDRIDAMVEAKRKKAFGTSNAIANCRELKPR
jgi:hypothetical protein